MIFRDVVPDPSLVMGVKAVFGPMRSHILCFGARGEPAEQRYFSVPRSAANRSRESPFIIAIGGGAGVRENLGGRVLNLAKASMVYGATKVLAEPEEATRLAQWPVASVMNDVWKFEGFPHLVDDLGLPDRTVLAAAMDGVVRPTEKIEQLWQALADWPVSLESLTLPANFVDAAEPTLVTKRLPTVRGGMASEEGKKIWAMQLQVERDGRLARRAKQLNIEKYEISTCEACVFNHPDSGMFDAHHPTPLAVGTRTTLAEHLIVLCPTCHRRAHRIDKLVPQTLLQIRQWVADGRP